jgi:hypothetical protein
MAVITLAGFTTPFLPNSGIAEFDTDIIPEQTPDQTTPEFTGTVFDVGHISDRTQSSLADASPMPIKVLSVTQTDTQLQITTDAPILLEFVAETHLPKQNWKFEPPTVINNGETGTVSQIIRRLLNRLPKKSISRL